MGRKKNNNVHSYIQYDKITNTSKCLVENCNMIIKGCHSTNLLRHFQTHHDDLYIEICRQNAQSRANNPTSISETQETVSDVKPINKRLKKREHRHDNYHTLKQICVDFVTVHNRPIAMFEDRAFKDLMNLIHMTDAERQSITSLFVQNLIDENKDPKDEDDDDMDEDFEESMSKSEHDEVARSMKIKKEEAKCMCIAQHSEDDDARHDIDCPAAVNQPYYCYFDVSIEEAKCLLCHKVVTWSDLSQLKEHLKEDHPRTKFKDDDHQYQSRDVMSNGSCDNTEAIYLDENFMDTSELATTSKKTNSMKISKKTFTPRSDAGFERHKSLDRFGLYVASLMKLIPAEKATRYQAQIVHRLLKEQPMAGLSF